MTYGERDGRPMREPLLLTAWGWEVTVIDGITTDDEGLARLAIERIRKRVHQDVREHMGFEFGAQKVSSPPKDELA